jgi:hypothetical protein
MIYKIEASSQAAGLELVDPMDREAETPKQASDGSAVGSAPQGDYVDLTAGKNLG